MLSIFKKHMPDDISDEDVQKYQEDLELEKGDIPAMIIAALITFFPILIVCMIVFYGLAWIIFT